MVKRELDISSYMKYRVTSTLMVNPISCNFNPSDGVYTNQIINWDGDIPDYIVTSETGDDINSRWFVIEAERKRGQQYELTLYRDTIADYYANILTSTLFIEKGMVQYNNSPLLFNAENMSFNQIKKKSDFLYDKSKCPWLVGYIAKNYPKTVVDPDDPNDKPDNAEINDIGKQASVDIINNPNTIKVNGIQNWEGYKYANGTYALNKQDSSRIGFYFIATIKSAREGIFDISHNVQYELGISYYNGYYGIRVENIAPFTELLVDNLISSNIPENVFTGKSMINDDSEAKVYMKEAKSFNNGIIDIEFANYIKDRFNIDITLPYDRDFFRNDKFYIYDTVTKKTYVATKNIIPIFKRMPKHIFAHTINTEGLDNPTTIKNSDYTTDFAIQLQNALPKKIPTYSGGGYDVTIKPISNEIDKNNNVLISSNGTLVSYTLTEVFGTTYKMVIPKDRVHLNDQPYDMFCIPYSDDLQYENEGRRFNASKDLALKTISAISSNFTQQSIYDIQILPYCPVQNIIDTDGDQVIINVAYSNYTPITNSDGTQHAGYIFWCDSSKFSFSIPYEIPDEQDPVRKKVKSMTEFCRIVSPAQGLEYTFDPMKNNGLSQINVQCTYKPYSPNIRICPEWNVGGLYENINQQNSQDGLIILEDCSLTQVTDKWAEYELNNKNYKNIFNRQVQSMEFNRDVSLGLGIANTVSGIANTVAGAMMGPVGIGTAVGGVTSTIGNIINTGAKYALSNEAIDLTKDNFSYQLGNIKALPLSLSKVSSFAVNNSLVPLIEFWSTTNTEKNIAYDKIKYQGMTISAIGNINQFRIKGKESYIKGQLIRLEGLDDDFHLVNTIAKELHQGLYFR